MTLRDRGTTTITSRSWEAPFVGKFTRARRLLLSLIEYIPDDVREFAERDIEGLREWYQKETGCE